MGDMAGTTVKRQDTEKKLETLSDHIARIAADRIILVTGLRDIKETLISGHEVNKDDLLQKVNVVLSRIGKK